MSLYFLKELVFQRLEVLSREFNLHYLRIIKKQKMILKLHNDLEKISDVQYKKTKAYLVTIIRNLFYDTFNQKTKLYL